jgi:repressor LexA
LKKELTDRQQEVLNFIQNYIEINCYPPTYREIGKQFNIVSTFGVKRHIDALVKKGYLNTENNSSRTLSLTNSVELTENKNRFNNIYEIPIVGRVAAGYPILAEENIEGTLSIDASLIKRKPNSFGLKVHGDSMINAGIFEGDVVIVNPQKEAENGDIIVALLQDEATMKRFKKDGSDISLIPENDNYRKIDISGREDFSIVGRVVGVFRTYN